VDIGARDTKTYWGSKRFKAGYFLAKDGLKKQDRKDLFSEIFGGVINSSP
jgi:hypothetical protein